LQCKINRVTTFCNDYNSGNCHSCEWITLAYPEQLVKKEEILKSALNLNATSVQLEPTVASKTTAFRNRAKMSVTGTSENPCIGLLGNDQLDLGRELLNCPIQHSTLNEVIKALPTFIREYNLVPYQINEKKGELKGLILFYSPQSDEMYLRFVLRSKECVSRIKKLLPKLQEQFPFLKCVSANIQPVPHALLEGPEEVFITEKTNILHQMKNFKFQLSPQAFVQTNADLASKLYETAAQWIAEVRPKKMLELFCGQGAFSFFASNSAENILGIEINESAVATANQTAAALGLTHLRFESMDARNAPPFGADLILVNPPRRGLGDSIQVILNQGPKHLVYSSCSHESLVKDLKTLEPFYSMKKVQIFDLFPHTEHFEILTFLERKQNT